MNKTKRNLALIAGAVAVAGTILSGSISLKNKDQEIGNLKNKVEIAQSQRDSYRKMILYGNPEGWQLDGDGLGSVYHSRMNGDGLGHVWKEYLY